jgi:hypothetical protein
MVCTEVPNQIKFVSRPHPTGSRTDFIYTDFVKQQQFDLLHYRRGSSSINLSLWSNSHNVNFAIVLQS